MDPYFIIKQNGKQVFKSSVQKKAGKQPNWPEAATLMVNESDTIEFIFYDKDLIFDDSLGSARIQSSQLIRSGPHTISINSKKIEGVFTFNVVVYGSNFGRYTSADTGRYNSLLNNEYGMIRSNEYCCNGVNSHTTNEYGCQRCGNQYSYTRIYRPYIVPRRSYDGHRRVMSLGHYRN